MIAVILAAGIGSRLGKPYPKCLNRLPYGESIIQRQVRLIREFGIQTIIVVVGFKKELIMEHVTDVFYCYNPIYYLTNTSKSLLTVLNNLEDDIIWMNGDIVFEKSVLQGMLIEGGSNKVAVNNNKCGEEEVKYRLGEDGTVTEISKKVKEANGEAVGINLIRKKDLEKFKEKLSQCKDEDYFEKGMELLIAEGIKLYPYNIENSKCIEVDFEADWQSACNLFEL